MHAFHACLLRQPALNMAFDIAVTDRDIHEAYDFCGPVLGKGSFATVLRVRDRMSGSEYAVKQVRSRSRLRLHETALVEVCSDLVSRVIIFCLRGGRLQQGNMVLAQKNARHVEATAIDRGEIPLHKT